MDSSEVKKFFILSFLQEFHQIRNLTVSYRNFTSATNKDSIKRTSEIPTGIVLSDILRKSYMSAYVSLEIR